MSIDYTFGSTGTIWTGVPGAPYFPGGAAVGLHVGSSGPTLVAWGLDPAFVGIPTATRVFLTSFPMDGRPEESSVRVTPLMLQGAWGTPLASCDIRDAWIDSGIIVRLAVLLQLQGTSNFRLCVATRNPASFTEFFSIREMLIDNSWLFAPDDSPTGGNVRMVGFVINRPLPSGYVEQSVNLAIVSTNRDRVRVAVLSGYETGSLAPRLVQEFSLANIGNTLLSELMRLDIASVRVYGTLWDPHLSIAFTAHRNQLRFLLGS